MLKQNEKKRENSLEVLNESKDRFILTESLLCQKYQK